MQKKAFAVVIQGASSLRSWKKQHNRLDGRVDVVFNLPFPSIESVAFDWKHFRSLAFELNLVKTLLHGALKLFGDSNVTV